jgi:ribosomal protein S18 acetylase RimI-like enzyme
MAVAMIRLKNDGAIRNCFVLDIDLHYGDGTVDILGEKDWVSICNPAGRTRERYLEDVEKSLKNFRADILGISAGFDNHRRDWGGLLETEDYKTVGSMVREVCQRRGAGYFAILEGGYRKKVLGYNVEALLEGMDPDISRRIYPADDMEEIAELFKAYADSLDFDLDFQDFETELKNLPGEYAPPGGAILVAGDGTETMGCVCLRKWESKICEMKRLYVKERFRRKKAGVSLAMAIIDKARAMGYEEMRLDTVSSMKAAISLYESLGFEEISPYRHNPVEGARFFALKL